MATLYGLARIGRDAEVRYTPGGDAVANLSLAFSWGRKGDDGNRPTQWVDGSLWGKRAESITQYLTKGTLVMVTLEDVHIEEFQGKNGPGHKLAGRISAIEFAGGAKTEQASPQQQRAAPEKPAPQQSAGFGDFDSDIPFMRLGREHFV